MSNNSNENLYVNQEMVNNQEESKDDMTYYTIPNKGMFYHIIKYSY